MNYVFTIYETVFTVKLLIHSLFDDFFLVLNKTFGLMKSFNPR